MSTILFLCAVPKAYSHLTFRRFSEKRKVVINMPAKVLACAQEKLIDHLTNQTKVFFLGYGKGNILTI